MDNKLTAPFPRPVACWSCVHKHPGSATCDAFPDGIPVPILDGHVDHRKPYVGDNGIRYEPVKPRR